MALHCKDAAFTMILILNFCFESVVPMPRAASHLPGDVVPPGAAPSAGLPGPAPPELHRRVPGQLDEGALGALQHERLALAHLQ